MPENLDDESAMNYCIRYKKNKDFNAGPWIPSKEAGNNKRPPNCNNVDYKQDAVHNSKAFYGGKKSRRKTRRSKKSHRKSSKKSHRKSRRGGKSRRGRR